MLIILTLRIQKQEDCHKLQVSLSYMAKLSQKW